MGSSFQIGPDDVIRVAEKVGKKLPPSRAKAYLEILDFPLIEHARSRAAGSEGQERAAQAEILRQIKSLGVLHFF